MLKFCFNIQKVGVSLLLYFLRKYRSKDTLYKRYSGEYKFLTLNPIGVMKIIITILLLGQASIVLANFFLIERSQGQVK